MDETLVEITASVINQQIDTVSTRLSGDVKSFWLKHISSFKKYIQSANKRYESTKTLLYKDQAVPLREIYVGTNISSEQGTISEIDFINQLLEGNRCVVTATAGAGKSFFSKSIFLNILAGKKSIPLFVELRNINGTDLGIIDYLLHDLKSNFKISMERNLLIQLIENGKFTLILDGYDELTNNRIKAVNAELKVLEVPFEDSSILITTRPGGEELEYLSGFTTFRIMPLNRDQAVSLINKLRYDDTVKNSFLQKLEKEMFDQHKDFLSNPLLLTIMLLTYSELAEIPSKMHIFYEQAFDTLFYRHDSSKGMYRRELKSLLAIDDFKDILSCLSASSYIRGQITLTNTDLLSFIRKAKQTANVSKLNPKDYIDDLVQSVCILLEDGTRYTYNHRSFQEYFAALFLIQIPTERKSEVYRRYLDREGTDNSLTLAFEMNQSMVEREFIKPFLDSLLEEIKTPEQLLKCWMRKLQISRRNERIPVGNGKRRSRLSKPRYSLIDATENWHFQMYIERMYQKASKKYIKFGIMTQKAFVDVYGNCAHSEIIDLNKDLKLAETSTVRKLGILEIANRRFEFLTWLKSDIDLREKRTGEHELETWL